MAYINVSEWKAEQVAEWLQGLDDSICPHAHSFLNNNVSGRGLLNVTVDDLYKLQVEKVGHQEIILEALDDLRNLHHNLDAENLQYVCLKLSCKARSLANEIRMYGPDPEEAKQSVETAIMSSVADVTDALQTLITWLTRPPFDRSLLDREALVRIGVELTTTAWRDTFAERPVNKIRDCCTSLADLADRLITEVDDPLVLQPASLDVATVRWRPSDEAGFGIVLHPMGGAHVIAEVRFQSAAHRCGRVHPGDEVVQVNYQTVVGWTLKHVLRLMAENPSELILTLKKRPRHLPVFGQIYVKPFRVPARKGGSPASSFFNNLPSSPRAELLVAPSITVMKPRASSGVQQRNKPKEDSMADGSKSIDDGDGASSSSEEEDGFLQASSVINDKSPTQSVRSLLSRPRSAPMRRATISGSSPSLSRPYINVSEVWSCQARNVQSFDQQPICTSSTLHSDDSGTATMSSNASHLTISEEWDLPTIVNWSNSSTPNSHISSKAPMPMPRTQLPAMMATNHPSPSGKKPIPQPRRTMHNLQVVTTKSNKIHLPNCLETVRPMPTSEFQSFRKVTRHPISDLPEYVNTTPPEVPARNQPPLPCTPAPPSSGSSRKPSELLQRARTQSSRRFSGDPQLLEDELPHDPTIKPIRSSMTLPLGDVQRRSSMEFCNSFLLAGSCSDVDSSRTSSIIHQHLVEEEEDQQSIPYYYMSDVVGQGGGGKELLPTADQNHLHQPPPELPPPFSPSSYSMQQELWQRNFSKPE